MDEPRNLGQLISRQFAESGASANGSGKEVSQGHEGVTGVCVGPSFRDGKPIGALAATGHLAPIVSQWPSQQRQTVKFQSVSPPGVAPICGKLVKRNNWAPEPNYPPINELRRKKNVSFTMPVAVESKQKEKKRPQRPWGRFPVCFSEFSLKSRRMKIVAYAPPLSRLP